jgi:hypothetical protein
MQPLRRTVKRGARFLGRPHVNEPANEAPATAAKLPQLPRRDPFSGPAAIARPPEPSAAADVAYTRALLRKALALAEQAVFPYAEMRPARLEEVRQARRCVEEAADWLARAIQRSV